MHFLTSWFNTKKNDFITISFFWKINFALGNIGFSGGPKGMEKGVIAELQKALGDNGELSHFEEKLKEQKQLFVETY